MPGNNSDNLQAILKDHIIEEIHNDHLNDVNTDGKCGGDPNTDQPSKDDAEHTTSPIIIDLNGDGVKTVAVSQNKIRFDHDNNLFAERTGWADAQDAILVIDSNQNGKIDGGSELFGNHSVLPDGTSAVNGFEALKALDENQDNVLNEQDSAWQTLQLWQDSNQNGKVDAGELKTLAEHGLKQINLDYLNINSTDEAGNQHKQTSTVEWQDGRITKADDVWFQTNIADTFYIGDMTVDADVVRELPQIYAFGNVMDLHDAATNDHVLKDMVKDYLNTAQPSREQLLNLIYRWTGSDDIDPYSRDPKQVYNHVMDARQLVTLEHLTGSDYLGTWCWGERDPNPHGQAAPKLIAEFNLFADYVAAHLAAFHNPLFWSYTDPEAKALRYDWYLFNYEMGKLIDNDQFEEAAALLKTARNLGNYNSLYQSDWQQNIEAVALDNPLLAAFYNSAILNGTAGADVLMGSAKDEYINGGAGDDQLNGGAGNDTYTQNIGFGKDRIYDSAGSDKIIFGAGITAKDIAVSRDLTAVYLTRLDENGQKTNDVIQIDNFYDFDGNLAEGVIETLQFADGTSLTAQDIENKLKPVPTKNDDFLYLNSQDNNINALAGSDTVFAGAGKDTVYGGAGDDVLYGDGGNDVLKGDAGNDALNGGDGDDVLDGGSGKDTLSGDRGNDVLHESSGDDVYLFAKGGGQDKIVSLCLDVCGKDTVQFTDWAFQAAVFERHGYDLLIKHHQTNDSILLEKFFLYGQNFSFAFTDQTVSGKTVFDMDIAEFGTEQNDLMIAARKHATMYGLGGNDTLLGSSGSDSLFGGDGADTLYGNAGFDTLNGGAGNDVLRGGDCAQDRYVFQAGHGQDEVRDLGLANHSDHLNEIVFENAQTNDAEFTRSGDHLIIRAYDNSEDQVNLPDFFNRDNCLSRAYSLVFDDQVLNLDSIAQMTFSHHGTNGIDILKGWDSRDLLEGNDGIDWLYGGNNDDQLNGGAGSDYLYGENGNDTLIGGAGNDKLAGGLGDDVYLKAKGEGQDTIEESGGFDTIQLSGQTLAETTFRKSGFDLKILSTDKQDTLTVKNFFLNEKYQVEQFQLADQTLDMMMVTQYLVV